MSSILYYPTVATDAKICLKSEDGRHAFTYPSVICDFCKTGGVIANGEVMYVPTEKGLEYHSRNDPNVLFWGGRGSGKSTTGRWDAHLRALSHPGFTYVVLRRTYPELQRSHLVHINREMKMLGGTFHNTDHIALYPNGSKGFFSHCQNDDDVLKLLSAEFALAVFDEISTFDWEMFLKLAASVRVPVGSGLTAMVRGLTNPLGPSTPKLMQYFVDKDVDPEEDEHYNPKDWFSIHANLVDNPHLDQKQYAKRFAGLPAHVRAAWVEGKYIAEDQLFTFHPFKNGKPYHVINEIDLKYLVNKAVIFRAIDVGWHPDPTICLWIAHIGDRYIVFKEKLWLRTIAADIAEDIKKIDRELGIKNVVMTFCDPSMDINTTADVRTVKDIFELNGIPMETSVNNRELYAASVHNALMTEIHLLDGNTVPKVQFVNGTSQSLVGCPYLIKSIPQQRYNPKKPLAMADSPNDHGVVALAYFLISNLSSDRTTYTPTKPRKWMVEKEPKRWVLGNESVRKRGERD